MAIGSAAPASAQLLPDLVDRLPVELPGVDPLAAPVGDLASDTLRATGDLIDLDTLAQARQLKVDALLLANPTLLEALPDDSLVIRSEVLALDPADGALADAEGQGFLVARERTLAGLDTRIVVLAAPPGMTTQQALDALRALDPAGAYDFNHVYSGSGDAELGEEAGDDVATAEVEASPASRPAGPAIGLIDGGVDAEHRAFRAASIVVRSFDPAGFVPSAHGTAVASLLLDGDAPSTTLFAADVYGGSPTGGAADSVAAALGWMAEVQVPVVNISLVGSENALLDIVISRFVARGHLLVAAVGNDGPSAPPLYPAAHPDVIAVTGVDRRRRALIEAGRGDHVMFAARGVDVRAAELGGGTSERRGTSFAAPVVARQLATLLPAPDPASARAALAALAASARDLGEDGRDPVFGWGLVDDRSAELLQASAPAD